MWPRKVLAGTGLINVSQMKIFDGSKPIDAAAVRFFKQNGYLMLRNAVQGCKAARDAVAELLLSSELSADKAELTIPDRFQSMNCDNNQAQTIISADLMSKQDWISANKALSSYLNHADLYRIFLSLFTELYADIALVETLPFKWLRAVGTGLFTGLHCDRVYVGNIAPCILTAWIPLGNITTELGSLIVCPGSHKNQTWKEIREEYSSGTAGKDGTTSGWLTTNPLEIESQVCRKSGRFNEQNLTWVSADFQEGDICIIDVDVMHITATNLTNTWRLSCDTRWVAL